MSWEKKEFLINDSGTIEYLTENMKLDPLPHTIHKVQSRWIKDKKC